MLHAWSLIRKIEQNEENVWTGRASGLKTAFQNTVFSIKIPSINSGFRGICSHSETLSQDRLPVCTGMSLVRVKSLSCPARRIQSAGRPSAPASSTSSSTSTSTGNRKSQLVSVLFIHQSTVVPITLRAVVQHPILFKNVVRISHNTTVKYGVGAL